jgi:protein TonB
MPRDRLSRPISPKAEGGQVSKPEPRRMEAGQEKTERPIRPESSVENALRRPTPRKEEMARLFPGASNLAVMEESYRRKYAAEVEERDTTFLNTDDIQFGSFLRRFEDAVYGVWRYPQAAAKLGIEGVTAVRITFNRRGEVARYDVLEGSGSRILDDEVGRVLRMVGTVGPFPRGYDKEEYHLIAFFRYSIVGGTIRGTLR